MPTAARGSKPEPGRKRIIVEVGCGILPFPRSGKRKIALGEHYLGIDVSKERLPTLPPELVTRLLSRGGQVGFTVARGEALPLPDESVHELHFVNIFGDLQIPVQVKRRMLAEARRALRPQGRIVVTETLTPRAKEGLRTLFAETGFSFAGFSSRKTLVTQYHPYPRTESLKELKAEVGSRYVELKPYVAFFKKKA
jgi:ubiquinone/menaquinone biosynthesis C-methylase UbiE